MPSSGFLTVVVAILTLLGGGAIMWFRLPRATAMMEVGEKAVDISGTVMDRLSKHLAFQSETIDADRQEIRMLREELADCVGKLGAPGGQS